MRAKLMLTIVCVLAGCFTNDPGNHSNQMTGDLAVGGGAGSNGGGNNGGNGGGIGSSGGGGGDMAIAADLAASGDYPPGPYGHVQKGDTIEPTVSWQCVQPGSTTPTTMTPKDFFDSDGSRKINVVLFDISATWCETCQQEADMEETNWTSGWSSEGVVPVTLMIEDKVRGSTATVQTAIDWINAHNLKHGYVCADPKEEFLMGVPGTVGLPRNLIVDPRHMTIYDVVSGYNPTSGNAQLVKVVGALAMQNAH
jgi:hypothetical protein